LRSVYSGLGLGGLDLPTFEANGMTLYKRLTMIVRGDTIEHVFYPIFPPNTHASEVLDWLRTNPAPPV
jgi:peroxiredoxin